MKDGNTAALTEHELAEIRLFIERRSGILFDESRTRFLSDRVSKHLKHRGLAHGTDLLRLVSGSNAEYEALLEILLTQETSFFRYPAVYEALEKRVLPELHGKKFWHNPRSLRIWSAGCSSGEEPYSIAISLLETLEFPEAWNVEILATDISRHALDIAQRGQYSRRDLASMKPEHVDAYFAPIGASEYRVKSRLRKMITFAQMNLAQMVYMGRFDCIFCMNVLIYFSDELRATLIRRFHECLESDGYLFLGHAESIAKANVDLEAILISDSLIYRKSMRSALQESV